MALIKCPECGRDISDKSYSCIHCGLPLRSNVTSSSQQSYQQYQQPQQNRNVLHCPYCGSHYITYQREQSGKIGAATNKVVVQAPKKSKGCFYWLLIGWWLEPIMFICFGWIGLLFGGKKKSGINISASKIINRTVAICQSCGHNWIM